MSDFFLWFITGLEHIADPKGYDHILFLLALCGVYDLKEWKKLLILVTAFTVGHSLTLALSVLDIVTLRTPLVEFLIPLTILVTCIYNLLHLNKNKSSRMLPAYFLAMFFGLIHGLGFSYLLKSLLGKEAGIAGPLLAFNLGLEAGQLLIVSAVLIISLVLVRIFRIQFYHWKFFLSSAVFGIAFIMAAERIPAF